MNMHETFSPPEAIPSSATAPTRSSWRSVGARLVAWAKACADHYAAAAAYENLSRLSDAQLSHRGLSRDILSRDLSEGCEQASEHLTSTQPHAIPPSTGVTTMVASGSWDARARARVFQTAAVLLVLFAVLAVLVLSVELKDTTHTAARSGGTPTQPTIERF